MIYRLCTLIPDANVATGTREGLWVSAMPLPYYGNQLKAAWEVLCGRAVAIRYPQNGEFEIACADRGWKVSQ